jgi:hypothetical protein
VAKRAAEAHKQSSRNLKSIAQAVGRRAQDAGESLVGHDVEAALLLVDVHAVEEDVGLVGAAAVDVAAARHAGLEREQPDGIARVQGKFPDAPALEGRAERGVRGVERGLGRAHDGDGFCLKTSLQPHVYVNGRVHQSLHLGNRSFLETIGLNFHAVVSGRDDGEDVSALVAGRLRARKVFRGVGERHGRALDDVALLVSDPAAHRRATGLREYGGGREDAEQDAA